MICRVLNMVVEALLAVPLWLSVLLAAAATIVLLATLAEKINALDSKNRNALYILCAIVAVAAVAMLAISLTGDSDSENVDEGMEIVTAVLLLLLAVPAVIALAALEIYIGIRFNRYDTKPYKNLGLCLIIYPIAACSLMFIGLAFDGYSVGAKIIDFFEAVNDCILIYFLYAALMRTVRKKDPVKAVISYGLIIYGFLVMLFAIDAAFNPAVANPPAKEKESVTTTYTEDDIDDFLDDLFDDD